MKRINKNKNEYNTNFNLKAYNNSKYSNLNVYYIDLINNVCYNKLLKFLVKYYDFVNSILLKVKIKDLTSIIVKPQKISYAFILSILIINTFFSLFFNLGNYSFVNGSIMGVFQGRLVQTTTDDEMWNSYVNLGMTRTYIDEEDTLEEVQEKVKKSCVRIGVRFYNDKNEIVEMKRTIIAGSAFVINIDSKYLYIATNRHACIDYIGKRLKLYPIFIDNELNEISQNYKIDGKVLGYTNNSDLGDFAIIQIDISNVPYEYKILFKSVPINKNEINVDYGTKGYFFHIEKNRSYTLREYSILNPIKDYYKGWATEKYYLQVDTNKAIVGDSGSYCFDDKGNLLGIVTGGYNNKITYLLKPNIILDGYENIVGEELE